MENKYTKTISRYKIDTNDKEWTIYLNTIKDKVMYADKDNQIFQSLIKDLMSNYT